MQDLENEPRRFSISIPGEARKELTTLKGGGTYWQVLKPMVISANEARNGITNGIIFLTTVYVDRKLKSLKQPIPLKVHISENGIIHLSNTDYKILVSCHTLQEAIDEARIEYDNMCSLFTNPDIPKSKSAISFGQKLLNAVTE